MDNYTNVVRLLEEIRSKTDGSVGGDSSNDLIKDPVSQKNILAKLDLILTGFKSLMQQSYKK